MARLGDEASGWRWWDRVLFLGLFAIGILLLLWGDGLDRLFGAVLVGVPALLFGWAAWKVLRERRATRGDG